jgi:hypothetical protein
LLRVYLQAALTYAEAQMKIDDPTLNDDLACGLRRLNSLAKILKKRRHENGFVVRAREFGRICMLGLKFLLPSSHCSNSTIAAYYRLACEQFNEFSLAF